MMWLVRIHQPMWILIIVIGLLGLPATGFSIGPQETGHPTPDPYFSQTTKKTNQAGSNDNRNLSSSWDAPNTIVRTKRKNLPFQPTSDDLQPLTSTPGTTPRNRRRGSLAGLPSVANTQKPSHSIIRQRSQNNDFQPNQHQQAHRGSIQPGQLKPKIEVYSSQLIVNDELVNSTGGQESTRIDGSPIQLASSTEPFGNSKPRTKNASLEVSNELSSGSVTKTTEHFEPGKVLALVGGIPIFAGDIIFEANRFIESKAPRMPEAMKAQQRAIMVPQMLPQFVDQKLRFVSVVEALPDKVNLEDVISQAEKEFNENALPKMLEQSGYPSIVEFDAQLRFQGSSLKKFRKKWSEDQLTAFFFNQRIQSENDITHSELIEAYREKQQTYFIPAKSKWEQVMVRFDKFASKQDAQTAIVELGNQLIYGANLAAVAKKSSH
ncbi:MAG: hypothetical protein AAF623_15935, partial [Planctomycetota bacterium]